MRRASFEEWPGVQDKDVMAENGFYFNGRADSVNCFYCGIGLQNWEPKDEPWAEHGKFAVSCPRIRFHKNYEANHAYARENESMLVGHTRQQDLEAFGIEGAGYNRTYFIIRTNVN